jgi:hypothetical protein
MERHTHFGTLAFIPDQDNQDLVAENIFWQEAGPFAMMEVSSAYCNMLVFFGDEPRA